MQANHLYYYRPLRSFGGEIFKCAGHGAEEPKHRAFFEPYFMDGRDNDPRFLPGCIVSEYQGDRVQIIAGKLQEIR